MLVMIWVACLFHLFYRHFNLILTYSSDLTLRKNSWFMFCFKYVIIDQVKKKNIVYDHHYCSIQIYTGETDLIH